MGGIVVMAGVIVVADFATKELALRNLAGRRGILRLVTSGRQLIPRDDSLRRLVVLYLSAVASVIAALLWAPALSENRVLILGLTAALAGAAGNVADRLLRGVVVDFIAIGRWPVFNLADVAIVGGAALAGASLLWRLGDTPVSWGG
jgi:signal peptidase II